MWPSQGIPVEFALLSILAAFGVSFGILYRALTLAIAGRKKRSAAAGSGTAATAQDATYHFADLLWFGKINKILE